MPPEPSPTEERRRWYTIWLRMPLRRRQPQSLAYHLRWLPAGAGRRLPPRRWSVAALALVSLAAFGSDTWHDFFVTAGAAHALYETDWAPFYAFANPYGAVRQLGGSVPFAYALQGLTTLFAAALVVVVWRRALPLPTRAAVLAAATPIAVPVSLYQDLMLDAIAMPGSFASVPPRELPDGKRPRWPASTSWHYTLGTWPSTGPCRCSRSPRQPWSPSLPCGPGESGRCSGRGGR
jgi:hypothetical protein